MANKSINVEVNGVTYNSKSDAIRALLAQGVRKSEVAKQLDAHYSFVMTIERAMLFANSEGGKAFVAQKAEQKAAESKVREEQKAAATAAKETAKVKREAERAAKKSEKVTVDAKKKDAAKKVKTAAKKVAVKKAAKASKKAESSVIDEANIAELLGTDDIPEDIRAEMVQDGLIDA